MRYWAWVMAALLWLCAGCGSPSEAAPYRDEKGVQVRYGGRFDASPVPVPVDYRPRTTEFRGVWVATVDGIDFPKTQSAAEFRREFDAVLDNLQSINVNTVIFQVRPTNDAFYRSQLNPWSRHLTGAEGKGIVDFDPLTYMVEATHKRGMFFHAWMNPYRVVGKTKLSKAEYLKTLSADNFARRNPNLVLEIAQGNERLLLLNPGEPEVIRFIVKTVGEVAYNYRIDAIHFDDYFYPYSGMGDQDKAAFARNNPDKLALADWRRRNVDAVIQSIHNGLAQLRREQNRRVEFGISPFGIWANRNNHPEGSATGGKEAYHSLYADVRKWIKAGWIDYVVPQIYWHFNHDVAAYACLTDWWSRQVAGTAVKLYIGHAAHQVGNTMDKRELAAQFRYNQLRPQVRGECIFSYRSIFRPTCDAMRQGVREMLTRYWAKSAAPPS